jgi:hypothetical protein
MRCASQRSHPARTRRPFCSFESVTLEPAMPFEATERHCTQRYSVQFPNSHTAVLTAHALLTVWHAALAGRAHSHFRQNRFLRWWQHCLVDCTQRSSTLWRKARLMKHIARVKYGGILAVAYDERRRLLIDRTIRKWRNAALRYRAVSMWRYDFLRPCVSAEACGASAAEHSPPGCSTCASDTGSARCELWFHVVDSNRMQAQSCLRRSNHVLCGRLR